MSRLRLLKETSITMIKTKINNIITCFTKYSNNLLSYPVRYCSCFRTHSGLLVHRYRTARATISARSRSIKMAERPIKPQALNTLTSFYKNKAPKAVKDWVCKQIIWILIILRYVWIEGWQQISASLWWKTGRRKNNCRSNLTVHKEKKILCN